MNTNTKQSSGSCDAEPVRGLLSVEQARTRILDTVTPVATREHLAIRATLGRVLAADIVSPVDVPPYANSAMDGYALRSADLPAAGERTLHVIGASFAGAPFHGSVTAGNCVRIMTGAVLPDGADLIVMQEQARRSGDDITVQGGHTAGENVRHAGDDIRSGSTVLSTGRRLVPADLGLIASLGIAEVSVYRRIRVAFFSTGDELRSLGEPLAAGQIYDSNRYTLHGMLTRLGAELVDLGVIPDQRARVEAAFQEAAQAADVVITSGGVSVGEADYVKETLDKLGAVNFWKIAMKPGKPLAYGSVQGTLFFGLPGNPVSVMATFYQFVQPALRRMMGESVALPVTLQVPCATGIRKQPGRTDFQRGVLARNARGELVVESTGVQGSHVLSSMSRANCFIILPAEWGDVAAGTPVEVQPFEGLL